MRDKVWVYTCGSVSVYESVGFFFVHFICTALAMEKPYSFNATEKVDMFLHIRKDRRAEVFLMPKTDSMCYVYEKVFRYTAVRSKSQQKI